MDTNTSQPRTSRIGGLEQLGKYELVCVLARSDLGSLWASVITYGDGLGQLMAVQRIVVRPGDEETLTEPIRQAVEALKGLRRPGVIPVVDCVVSPGRLGVVSEYVEGEPLRSLQNLASLKKSPISAGVAIRLGLDILEGLVEFHGLAAENESLAKYVYGGLSPDTVVVTVKGKAHLLNPGLAAVAASLPALSWHTAALAYRSPEHLGSGKPVDARTDVFVAGVMLWELLAQKPLFQTRSAGGTPSEPPRSSKRNDQVTMAQQVLSAPIERLDKPALPTPVSKELADVIDKALQREPAARFGSAREMAEALALAAKDMTASTTQVAEMVEALASSTLTTRRSAIARAGVEVAPEPSGARKTPSDDEDVFGSDWVVDADSGSDEKIHALGAGALAVTPSPSAAIAVGPKPVVAPKTAVAPKAAVASKAAATPKVAATPKADALRTPPPGIVRPTAKADVAKAKPQAAKAGDPKATPAPAAAAPAEAPKPAEQRASPVPPVATSPADDDFGIDVELSDDEAAHVAPDSGKSPAPPSRRPPPPPVVAKAGAKEAADKPPVAPAGPAPTAVDVPPPQPSAEGDNAFMSDAGADAFSGGGDDVFAAPKVEKPVESSEQAVSSGMWSPPADKSEPTEVQEVPPPPAEQPAGPARVEEEPPAPISARPQVDSESDEEIDARLAMAAQRRRKGYVVIGIMGGLAVLVGLGALIHVLTSSSPEETPVAAKVAPPAPTPAPTPSATAEAPAATTAQPAPAPSATAEPAPTESVAAASAEPTAPSSETGAPPETSKPATPKPPMGKPRPPTGKPKPYTPSGI